MSFKEWLPSRTRLLHYVPLMSVLPGCGWGLAWHECLLDSVSLNSGSVVAESSPVSLPVEYSYDAVMLYLRLSDRRWFMVTSFLMMLRNKQGCLGEGLNTPAEESQGGGCCGWFLVTMDIATLLANLCLCF